MNFFESFISVLFNEPKLLKYVTMSTDVPQLLHFSALQRAEIAEMPQTYWDILDLHVRISVLFNEPKLLK